MTNLFFQLREVAFGIVGLAALACLVALIFFMVVTIGWVWTIVLTIVGVILFVFAIPWHKF